MKIIFIETIGMIYYDDGKVTIQKLKVYRWCAETTFTFMSFSQNQLPTSKKIFFNQKHG